ncbi:MAG TPA: hypothetical protein VL381_07470 [Rhodocyclaceae bacterium]|nr:hypothetical protein [Rhodocyclaceae bacterium]
MKTKHAWYSKCIGAALLVSASYAASAAALTCPVGEIPAKDAKTCVPRDDPKPQLDINKFNGSLRTQAVACNAVNETQAIIVTSATEISRINASLNDAQHELQKLPKDGNKAEAQAKIDNWKNLRSVEEKKIREAEKAQRIAKKKQRAAAKQVEKEGMKPLDCL